MDPISFSVQGKHVLISGGAGGIGSAFAKAFLQHGAHVTITDLKAPADELLQAGARFEFLDVTSDDAVLAVSKKIDTLDVLIHCAGKLKRWEEHQPEVFRNIVDIHLFGNVRLASAFRPHLKRTRGCMINIGSMYSYFGAPQVPAYAAAKTAVVGLTRSLALAYIDDGIRVNAIAPGWVMTERQIREHATPEKRAANLDAQAIKRELQPEDIAAAALFLCSRGASAITGQTLIVDGGISYG